MLSENWCQTAVLSSGCQGRTELLKHTDKIQAMYRRNTNKIQMKYRQNTDKIQMKYRQNTDKIQTKYRQNKVKIQTKYKENTNKIQSKYRQNTDKIKTILQLKDSSIARRAGMSGYGRSILVCVSRCLCHS